MDTLLRVAIVLDLLTGESSPTQTLHLRNQVDAILSNVPVSYRLLRGLCNSKILLHSRDTNSHRPWASRYSIQRKKDLIKSVLLLNRCSCPFLSLPHSRVASRSEEHTSELQSREKL